MYRVKRCPIAGPDPGLSLDIYGYNQGTSGDVDALALERCDRSGSKTAPASTSTKEDRHAAADQKCPKPETWLKLGCHSPS